MLHDQPTFPAAAALPGRHCGHPTVRPQFLRYHLLFALFPLLCPPPPPPLDWPNYTHHQGMLTHQQCMSLTYRLHVPMTMHSPLICTTKHAVEL